MLSLRIKHKRIILGDIRADLGRHAVPSHYREHASKQGHLLKDFYCVEKQSFVTETQSGEPTEQKQIWSVWADINDLVEFINNKRQKDCCATSSSQYSLLLFASLFSV